MLFFYSLILAFGFLLMLPLFLLRREKYASGFQQRLGNYPEFNHDGREVIWLHCVSVGETNAARPLVDQLLENFPDHRLVISTTTKTGQELAKKIFAGKADAIFYFPFDFKISVRRALANYKPSLILLMETEIWPRFIREAKLSGAKIAIVNGRLSQRSFDRYSRVSPFVKNVLADIGVALMQGEADAKRMIDLGIDASKVAVTGNLKFDQSLAEVDAELTDRLRSRFCVGPERPLIIAASTHEPEEQYVLDAFEGEIRNACRLMIVPRHPERFDAVAKLLRNSDLSFVRRSSPPSNDDKTADLILLDTIGELRAAIPLAEIVFVGGSLIPHGGQSILEPAAEGKAIITGPYTENFDTVVKAFLEHGAISQMPVPTEGTRESDILHEAFAELFDYPNKRVELGRNALELMRLGRGATQLTVERIRGMILSDNLKTENF